MPLEVVQLEEADRVTVEEFVRKSPDGSVFSLPSWAAYRSIPHYLLGVYRGTSLVGAGVIPVSGNSVPAVVRQTPWVGIVGRPEGEGERSEIAGRVAEYLLARHDDVTLTLPPEWDDVRGFLWNGMRVHVRYTYRGLLGKPEKRVNPRPAFVQRNIVMETPNWVITTYETGDSKVTVVHDWACSYYWDANPGGRWHTECIVNAMVDADSMGHGFDMVGCNSPNRGLFKRGFGYPLAPYYVVTTLDPATITEFWGDKTPLVRENGRTHRDDLLEVSARADAARAAGV